MNVRSGFGWVCMLTALMVSAGERPQVTRHVDFANMKLVLTDGAMRDIQADVDALTRSDTHFQIQLDRVSLYFPIIEKIFREENVPEDFKYLVIQESGLISDAVSSAKAVGFWQFKDFTAREMGLRVDNRIDERKNIVSATRAAAQYLKRNNFHFDNWAYALSAYQAGLGGVRKYVDRKNFGARKLQINKNTHWYLKKYIAHKIAYEKAIGHPHREGLRLDIYSKGKGRDLKQIAREVKVEHELLVFYNKWIKYGKIPADKEYAVIVPTHKRVKNDRLLEEQVTEIEVPEEIVYPDELKEGITRQRGVRIRINGVPAIMASELDELTSLAAIGELSNKKFRKYNDLFVSDEIVAGEIYFLGKKKSKSPIGFHIAREGETLRSISQHYGMRVKSLARKNRIEHDEKIGTGQVMWLNSRRPKDIPIEYHDLTETNNEIVPPKPVEPFEKESVSADDVLPEDNISDHLMDEGGESINSDDEATLTIEKVGKTHVVVQGETLWGISRQYDVSVEDLKFWNNLTKYDTLRVNQEVYVKEPRLQEKKERQTKTYRVRPGDTLYRIAEAHEMEVSELMDLNDKKDSYLSVGEELKVFK